MSEPTLTGAQAFLGQQGKTLAGWKEEVRLIRTIQAAKYGRDDADACRWLREDASRQRNASKSSLAKAEKLERIAQAQLRASTPQSTPQSQRLRGEAARYDRDARICEEAEREIGTRDLSRLLTDLDLALSEIGRLNTESRERRTKAGQGVLL